MGNSAIQKRVVDASLAVTRWLGIDLKRRSEFRYWSGRMRTETVLSNDHYEQFYTTHFGLSRDFYGGLRILDIGCGPRGSLEWADMAAERVGLDPLVDDYLKLGIARHRMSYVKAPSEKIPFPDGHFEVVCSFNSLDHVSDLSQTIREIIRVVAPGGLFLLLTDVNHGATYCEPNEYSFDVVNRFLPALTLVQARKYEKLESGLYQSVLRNVPYDESNTGRRTAILSAKFCKTPVPASA
jgi:ubiquinone/menaquinone biosynthesis C-methylase UbiE